MIDPQDPGTLQMRLPAPPKTGAERQKLLRKTRREAGIKAVHVSAAERELMAHGLCLLQQMGGPGLEAVPGLLVRLLPGAADLRRAEAVAALQLRQDSSDRSQAERTAQLEAENHRLRAIIAEIQAELGGAPVKSKPGPSVEDLQAEVARLRADLEKQHLENLFTIAEQGKTASAVERLQRRLNDAGLPSDYRAQPGEH